MKTIQSVGYPAAAIALGIYCAVITQRVQHLEARLRSVEANLAAPAHPQLAVSSVPVLRPQAVAPSLPVAQVAPIQNNLEGRVEKLERQLSPHFEYLPNATKP